METSHLHVMLGNDVLRERVPINHTGQILNKGSVYIQLMIQQRSDFQVLSQIPVSAKKLPKSIPACKIEARVAW